MEGLCKSCCFVCMQRVAGLIGSRPQSSGRGSGDTRCSRVEVPFQVGLDRVQVVLQRTAKPQLAAKPKHLQRCIDRGEQSRVVIPPHR